MGVLRLVVPRTPQPQPTPAAVRSSDGVHEVALGGIEKDSDLAGMDQAVFAAAPPEAMRGLMQVGGQVVVQSRRGGCAGPGQARSANSAPP